MAQCTEDRFLGGALRIRQPAKGYRAGIDAVLLAAAAPIEVASACRVLDLGAGAGVVGLSIAMRAPRAHITLAEIDPGFVGLASDNIALNSLAQRVSVVMVDAAGGGAALHSASRPAGLSPASFEHVVTNPPYYELGTGTPSALEAKAGAHQMREGGLNAWLAFAATAATPRGTLSLIHRADALGRVLAALEGRFGGIRIKPVHAFADAPASRILVTAVKGSRAPLTLMPGLVLQDRDGAYRPEVDAILRQALPLAV